MSSRRVPWEQKNQPNDTGLPQSGTSVPRTVRSFWITRVFSLLTVFGATPHCEAISAGVSPFKVAWIRAASRGLSDCAIASRRPRAVATGSRLPGVRRPPRSCRAAGNCAALGPFLDGIDRAEEVGTLRGLTAQDVADARVADLGHQGVELRAAEVLEQRHVDRLRAVVVHLGRDPRAVPGPTEVAVQLRDPGRDRFGIGPVTRLAQQSGQPRLVEGRLPRGAREQGGRGGIERARRREQIVRGGNAGKRLRGVAQQAERFERLDCRAIRPPLLPFPLHARPSRRSLFRAARSWGDDRRRRHVNLNESSFRFASIIVLLR